MIVMNDRALQDVLLGGQDFVKDQLSQVQNIFILSSLYNISSSSVFQGQTKEEINEILEKFHTPTEWPWTGSDKSFALIG